MNPDQMQNWEDIGENIRDIIDSAVNSQDYQMLNQNIRKAVGAGAEAVRKAVDTAQQYQQRQQYQQHQQYGQYQQYQRRGVRTNKNIYSSKLGSMSANPHTYEAPQQPRQNLPVLYRSTSGKKAGGIVKTVFGGILTFGSSMGLIASAIVSSLLASVSFLSFSTVTALMGLGGGVYLLTSGIRTIGRVSRFEKYVQVLGRKTYATLEQLARSVGKSEKYVRRELPGMIQEGLFLEGHLDAEQTSLITSDETYAQYRQLKQQQEEKKLQAAREELLKPQPPKVTPQVQEVLDKGNAFIRQIRSCNDAIPGEEISEKITRIENLVAKIFSRAEAHPEIVPDLKKMMDYYLPMTVKLLNAYADMDAQPIQGETIRNSKREIEDALDTLNQAFEKLLDSVFRDTALDVSSDISVLQTLLAQEGLTDDGISGMRKH